MKRKWGATGRPPVDPAARAPLRKALLAAALAGVLALILVWTGKEPAPPAPAPFSASPQPPAAAVPPMSVAQPPPAAGDIPVQDVPAVDVPFVQVDRPPGSAPVETVAETVRIVASPAGHVLQLGVFGVQENAERRRDELARAGFSARVESRVVLGPYPDRAAAEQAQKQLRASGLDAGIVVPPNAP